MITKYRIGILNDFKNSYAYADFKDYGEIQFFNVSISSSTPDYQKSTDDIGIFLNYKLIARFKEKAPAIALVNKLLSEAPKQSLKDFNSYGIQILEAL